MGYAEITESDNLYFLEVMYNYAKIEAFVPKEKLNESLILICNILSSVKFNDKVLETLIGENKLNYKEEAFNLFKPKRETGNFLDYIEEYDKYEDLYNELPDEDKIEAFDKEQ